MTGPLSGVRILDLTHVWAGPLAVRFLSDLGAEVVRVEAPFSRGPREASGMALGGWIGGEPAEEPWNRNAIFVKLMRNRKSLCIDLKHTEGRSTFLELVGKADVVMENFSARTMPALGLDWETLKACNPNLVYLTMPGFGHDGPLKHRVAFGPSVEAMSGLTEIMGYGPDEPRNTAMALMDPITALNAVAAVMTALEQRSRQGGALRVEMSLYEGGVSYSGPWLIDRQLNHTPRSMGNRHPEMVPHGVYRCLGEDQWIAIAIQNEAQWVAFARLLGLDASWDFGTRRVYEQQIDEAIEAWTGQQDKLTAAESLQASGIPAGPVNTVPDMVADPQVQARGFFVPFERFDTPMPGTPIKMDGVDPDSWTPCPSLGADNERVLKEWLEYSDDAIALLKQASVLADKPPA